MLTKGKEVELTIESLAPGGEGVSKSYAIPVFINKVAPGDKLLVEIYDNRRTFAKGKLVKVIEPGPDRIEPLCKLFKVCGGCQWMHLSYQAQLVQKKAIIAQALRHIGGQEISNLCSQLIEPTIPSRLEFAYRNKVNLPVRNPRDSKRLLAGYFETNSHDLVNIKHCPIQPALLDIVLEQIKILAEKNGITAYDEALEQGLAKQAVEGRGTKKTQLEPSLSNRGILRHIQMRFSEAQQNVLVTLVVNRAPDKLPPSLTRLTNELMSQNPAVVGVSANCNLVKGNRILADETVCLAGQSYIEEVLRTEKADYPTILKQGLKFQLSPTSFFQINTSQAVTLLEIITAEIRNYLKQNNLVPGKKEPDNEITLLDAYAGVGSIALWLAPFVDNVLAVEDNPAAVKDGENNLSLNKINNVQFYRSKVEDFLPTLLEVNKKVPIVVLDPPRQGLSPSVVEAIMKLAPEMIVYVSCNPATLARDLRLILSNDTTKFDDFGTKPGYKVEKIMPIDLFPQTYHVESVTVLRKIT